ncbi:type II secretion system major pseudopilin GspG [Klebsiella pneumoniae]|nr:type II secretion system major pseudopilin GspG [Klebsiella pneumoniae]
MQRQRGFTLLEIMVVIVILGILASLVVPNLMGNKEKADRQKVVSDLVALEGALDMYKLDNSRYPNTEQGLQALVTAPAAEPHARNYPEGGYIRRLPQDPWGNEYQLLSPGQHGAIDVFSVGQAWTPGEQPDVLIFPGGEVTPFQLRIDAAMGINVDAQGDSQPLAAREQP